MFLRDVTDTELSVLIRKMRNKSCSTSAYPIKAVKNVCDLILPVLLTTVNGPMNRSIFPNSLKVAKVIPLPKKCAATDVSDFKPISILPVSGKIFERVVFNRLYNFLEKI